MDQRTLQTVAYRGFLSQDEEGPTKGGCLVFFRHHVFSNSKAQGCAEELPSSLHFLIDVM